MIVHTFLFRWKPGTTELQKSQAIADILALQDKIPGILETLVGTNFSPRSQGYEFGGIIKFADKQALEAYSGHPAHQQLVGWLMPLIDAIEVDLEV